MRLASHPAHRFVGTPLCKPYAKRFLNPASVRRTNIHKGLEPWCRSGVKFSQRLMSVRTQALAPQNGAATTREEFQMRVVNSYRYPLEAVVLSVLEANHVAIAERTPLARLEQQPSRAAQSDPDLFRVPRWQANAADSSRQTRRSRA